MAIGGSYNPICRVSQMLQVEVEAYLPIVSFSFTSCCRHAHHQPQLHLATFERKSMQARRSLAYEDSFEASVLARCARRLSSPPSPWDTGMWTLRQSTRIRKESEQQLGILSGPSTNELGVAVLIVSLFHPKLNPKPQRLWLR